MRQIETYSLTVCFVIISHYSFIIHTIRTLKSENVNLTVMNINDSL